MPLPISQAPLDEGVAPAVRPPTPDATLIERSRARPDAFAELFERHAGTIHRYIARRLGVEAADDLLGETFASAFQHRARYDLSRPDALPWLYGIATNVVHRHRRAEARRLRALARALEPDGGESLAERSDARVSAEAARAELAGALGRLPAAQRDVLLLTAWAELDYEQAAEALGVPVGTVRSRLHRARLALREALAPHLLTEDG